MYSLILLMAGVTTSLPGGSPIAWSRRVCDARHRVNAVCPLIIQTPMSDQMIASGQGLELEAMMKTHVPMARLGRPEEIAYAVLWLCSPAASYVTGSVELVRRRLRHAVVGVAIARVNSKCARQVRAALGDSERVPGQLDKSHTQVRRSSALTPCVQGSAGV